jgi:hypothetical protein
MNHLKPLLFISLTIFCISCQKKKSFNPNNPLIGAWKVQQVSWISQERTATIDQAQPGVFIFSENSYSLQWTPTKKARVPFEILSKPTDKEAIAGFKSVVFNAGNYQYTDSKITTTAIIAKVPGFEGGQIFYTYQLNQDLMILTMVDELYPDGSKPDWSGKWSTQFTLKRISY